MPKAANEYYYDKFATDLLMVVKAMIDEYFNSIFYKLPFYTHNMETC